MVSALVSGSSGSGSSPGHCIVYLGTTLTFPFSAQVYKWILANVMLGEPCDGLASHPGGVEILVVAPCYRNRDKLRPDGPPGSYADFTYLA